MYFLATYAIIEYLKGNPKFTQIIDTQKIVTSNFQLMELYYYGLKEFNEKIAETFYEGFSNYLISIPENSLKNAMKIRLELQRKKINISYVDAIGYQYSIDNDLKFVTGDIAFKNLDPKNIEYLGK